MMGDQGIGSARSHRESTLHGAHAEAAPSAAARVTKALDMACQYSGGISYGDGPNAELLSWGDIRDVIDQHRELLAALQWAVTAAERLAYVTPAGVLRDAIFDKTEQARLAIAKATGGAS